VSWVKLRKYCELSGETADAVHSKRRKGMWADGIHCRIAGDGNLWINLDEVDRWVATSKPAQRNTKTFPHLV
jgi:hypothetical protein